MSVDDVSLPSSLEFARIDGLPSTAYYIPNFISVEEERFILSKVRQPGFSSTVVFRATPRSFVVISPLSAVADHPSSDRRCPQA
jgi:alkylated DNA repair protein alkB family protein 6